MLSDSVELLLDDGNAHLNWNEISVNHKFTIRFHFKFVARTYTPRGVLP